jgi:hypothetical protein
MMWVAVDKWIRCGLPKVSPVTNAVALLGSIPAPGSIPRTSKQFRPPGPKEKADALGSVDLDRRTFLVGTGAVLLAAPLAATQAVGPGSLRRAELLAALRGGGYIMYFRHADTDHNQHDTPGQPPQDCAKQRNLTDRGRDHARAIGQAIGALTIPIGSVLASPLCRTVIVGDIRLLLRHRRVLPSWHRSGVHHSITWSARASTDRGIVRPRALAALRIAPPVLAPAGVGGCAGHTVAAPVFRLHPTATAVGTTLEEALEQGMPFPDQGPDRGAMRREHLLDLLPLLAGQIRLVVIGPLDPLIR